MTQSTQAATATQVSQFGITWTFDKEYTVGQYANGDYWVLGPVKIVSFSPASYTDNNSPIRNRGGAISGYRTDHVKNGAMLNPIAGPFSGAQQGYNSNGYGWNPSLNVAYGVSSSSPLVINVGGSEPAIKSLISTIALDWWESDAGWPKTQTAAILTIVANAPSANAFRPPYCYPNSFSEITTDDINMSSLANLNPVAGSYGVNDVFLLNEREWSVLRWLERPWILHGGNISDNILPRDNMPYYGREQGRVINMAALILNMKCSTADQPSKDLLLIRFLQHAIDMAAMKTDPNGRTTWANNGGILQGRVLPTVFAAKVLRYNPADSKNFSNVVRQQHLKSGQYRDQNGYTRNTGTGANLPPDYINYGNESDQIFYVTQADVALSNSTLWNPDDRTPISPYNASDINLPDWGLMATTAPSTINKHWEANYRSTSASIQPCAALVAHIMGLEEIWNNPAFFDYCDRHMSIISNSGYEAWQVGTNGVDQYGSRKFVWNTWNAYRNNYSPKWIPDNPGDIYSNGRRFYFEPNIPPPQPIADAGPDQTLTDSDLNGSEQVTLNGTNSSDPDGSIVSYIWTVGGSQIASGTMPTVTMGVGQHTITLTVTDNGGLTDTDTVVVTIEELVADTTPPSITSVAVSENSVEITFNEALDQASALETDNYSLSNGLTITTVRLISAYNRVTLETSSHQLGTSYTLTVAAVEDTAGNTMPLTTRAYVYSNGLAGHWTFDDTNNGSVTDISGHNNTGIMLNGTQATAAGEASFTGAYDAVQIPTAGLSTGQGTIALWARPASQTGRQYLFGHAVGSWSSRIQIYIDNGYLCLGMGNTNLLQTNIRLLDIQNWYHIALSWNGTNYVLYIDGEDAATGTYTGLTQLNSIADIGNTGNTTYRNEGFIGLIDEVRVYSRPLTSDEIADLALAFLPIGDKTVVEGNQLSFSIRTKPGITMELSSNNLPGTPVLNSNVFTWTTNLNNAGNYEAEFTAQNGVNTDYERINITVIDAQSFGEIGFWKFDETSGENAADSSSASNDGCLRNGLEWSEGKIDGAVALSVPNDAVEISTRNLNVNAGTISMWVYVERQTMSRHYLFGHADSNLNNRIQLYLKYGNLCLGLGNVQELQKNIYPMENQRWYHVALVWNSTSYRVYVNGAGRVIGTFPGLSGFGSTADIGNTGIFRDKALNGKIDDVRIYNRVLSSNEIAQLAAGN